LTVLYVALTVLYVALTVLYLALTVLYLPYSGVRPCGEVEVVACGDESGQAT